MAGGIEGERPRRELTSQTDQQEQAQPQQESVSGHLERSSSVFECVLPKSTEPPSLFWIQRKLGDGMLKIDEVPALEQQWLDYLKTMDRQALEIILKKSEERLEQYKESHKLKQLTVFGQELLPALEKEVKLIREGLYQDKTL